MNYRHVYHAGNFADVVKHVVILELLHSLQRKETPLCYLETHAGRGHYDLKSPESQKSNEYLNGIAKIFFEKNAPPIVNIYLSLVKKLNVSDEITIYPGSPYLVKQMIRPQDRMVLNELQSQESKALYHLLCPHKKIAVHTQDGYQALNAFLPPFEKRGLIVIDPPYENPDDYQNMSSILSTALKRFRHGTYLLWYPLKKQNHIIRFQQDIINTLQQPLLNIHFSIFSEEIANLLHGCGLLIINPPWQLESRLEPVLEWLWSKLNINNQGSYQLKIFN